MVLKKTGKNLTSVFIIFLVLVLALLSAFIYWLIVFSLPLKTYTASDFHIKTVQSKHDHNNNGIDDYADIVIGARRDAQNMPQYVSKYYVDGYPPDNEGVCTDLVWRAFKNAGISLKDLLDEDIKSNLDKYPRVNSKPDPNIDFRRVPNLFVFFERKATKITLDTSPSKNAQWQPGDIVTYGTAHIAIVSDKRNKNGRPYIIHNTGQLTREEDALNCMKISGHYRFEMLK